MKSFGFSGKKVSKQIFCSKYAVTHFSENMICRRALEMETWRRALVEETSKDEAERKNEGWFYTNELIIIINLLLKGSI